MEELRGTDFHEVREDEEPTPVSWCGFHLEVVMCDRKECYRCGWHPKVAQSRKKKLRKEFAENVR